MSGKSASDRIVSQLVAEDPSFADLVSEYLRGLSAQVGTLRSALRAGELDSLRTIAHQLKGSGGAHGFPLLTQKAAVLEDHAVQKQAEACAQALQELADLIARLAVS